MASTKTRGLKRDEQEYRKLREALARVGYFCKGSILSRTMKCGRPGCPCALDPRQRHGPYFQWTYKVSGKTVSHRLTPEQARVYQEAAAEFRKLKAILRRMETLSHRALALKARIPAP